MSQNTNSVPEKVSINISLAADVSVEDAVDAIRDALSGEMPPLSHIRLLPWYVRVWWPWVPMRWRQRWILRDLERHGHQ